ncbi:MAG: hypothetical protein JST22_18855 [Bacteroidetes bacterium]|nr:hypothetical protein [Bacteroidota bacterium]
MRRARAQGMDSALTYFPLHVEDVWQYGCAPAYVLDTPPLWFEKVSAEGDSLMPDGERYVHLVSHTSPSSYPAEPDRWLRVDSASGIVYIFSTNRGSAVPLLYLRCDSSLNRTGEVDGSTVGCRERRADTLLGIVTVTRDYGQLWEANGYSLQLGLSFAAWDLEGDPKQKHLLYARIGGREFGRLQGVQRFAFPSRMNLAATMRR